MWLASAKASWAVVNGVLSVVRNVEENWAATAAGILQAGGQKMKSDPSSRWSVCTVGEPQWRRHIS